MKLDLGLFLLLELTAMLYVTVSGQRTQVKSVPVDKGNLSANLGEGSLWCKLCSYTFVFLQGYYIYI